MNRIRHIAALAAVLLTLAGAAPAVAHDGHEEVEPLGSRAMRADLQDQGYRNGRLPTSLLDTVPGGTNETCRLEPDAAAAWELLLLAAESDGVTGFAAGWCYRSLSQQRSTYARNCGYETPPTPPVAEGEEPPPPPTPVFRCTVPTAKPGTSNHGWGRAVDVVDTTTSRDHLLTCRDAQFAWLVERGPEFGWVHPSWARCGSSKQEAWHFEWAGVNVDLSHLIIQVREELGIDSPV